MTDKQKKILCYLKTEEFKKLNGIHSDLKAIHTNVGKPTIIRAILNIFTPSKGFFNEVDKLAKQDKRLNNEETKPTKK